MNIFSFVECSIETRSLPRLFELLVAAATDLGFESIAYGPLNYHEPIRLAQRSIPAVATNYPADWCSYYFEKRYHEFDPVILRTPGLSGPFLWEQLGQRFHFDAREQLVLREAQSAGLKRGVCIPLFGPSGRVSVMSFVSSFDDAGVFRPIPRLTALACHFHVAFREIVPQSGFTPPIELSLREKECLRWIADGKSSWDIGMILNISENTVNFHIKNAMRKLETTNRTVAVVKALRLGLVDFPRTTSARVAVT